MSAPVRYRHRPIAAAKRGEKTVIFDFCVRFDLDAKGRNVGFGVNLPFYLKLKAVYHLFGKLRTTLKSKCCLKAISLVRAQLILSRNPIRKIGSETTVYAIGYRWKHKLRLRFNLFPFAVFPSEQFIRRTVLNRLSGAVYPPQIQNNIRADLTDVDHFETYSRRVAFGFQKAKLPKLTSLIRRLSAVSDIYHRRKNAGGSGYHGEN